MTEFIKAIFAVFIVIMAMNNEFFKFAGILEWLAYKQSKEGK